jgi:ribose transport system permease protein
MQENELELAKQELLLPTARARQRPETGRPSFLLSNEFGLIVLIAVFATAFALIEANFVSRFNLFALSRTAAVYAMIGMAMMAVIVTGGLNLAVGAIGACAAMTFGWAVETQGLHWLAAIGVTLLLAAALGFINGWLVVRTGIHSFVITLATMSIFFGCMVFLTHAQSFRGLPPGMADFGRMRLLQIVSPLLVVAVLVALLLAAMYRYTALGREMLAAGATPEAAELSGVNVGRSFILCHVLSALLAGVTALLVTARFGAAMPSMAGQLGQDWLLPAFLAPVLGGTLLAGGRVSVLGTFLGAVLVTMLTNGLLLLQVGEFWVQAFLGLLLLLAVLGDKARRQYLAHRGLVA